MTTLDLVVCLLHLHASEHVWMIRSTCRCCDKSSGMQSVKVKQKKQVQSLEQENDCKQNHIQISQIYKQKQIGNKHPLFYQTSTVNYTY